MAVFVRSRWRGRAGGLAVDALTGTFIRKIQCQSKAWVSRPAAITAHGAILMSCGGRPQETLSWVCSGTIWIQT